MRARDALAHDSRLATRRWPWLQTPSVARERFKKVGGELAEARRYLGELRLKQAQGPPKCFTVGCTQNYEYDLWRYKSKDDYTGEGLEKPDSILKPPGFSFEGK